MNEPSPACCPLPHKDDPDRPRPGAPLLCSGHTGEITAAIAGDVAGPARLPGYHAALSRLAATRALTASAGHRSAIGSLASERLVIDPAATEHRTLIEAQLAAWVRMVADERDFRLPPVVTVPVLCAWLAIQLDWCLAQPWADELALEVLAMTRRAYGLLHPRPERWISTTVPCPCGGTWLAYVAPSTPDLNGMVPDPEWVTCDTCGEEGEFAAVKRLGQPRTWLTWEQLCDWTDAHRLPRIRRATLDSWAARAQVATRRREGQPLQWSSRDVADRLRAERDTVSGAA